MIWTPRTSSYLATVTSCTDRHRETTQELLMCRGTFEETCLQGRPAGPVSSSSPWDPWQSSWSTRASRQSSHSWRTFDQGPLIGSSPSSLATSKGSSPSSKYCRGRSQSELQPQPSPSVARPSRSWVFSDWLLFRTYAAYHWLPRVSFEIFLGSVKSVPQRPPCPLLASPYDLSAS